MSERENEQFETVCRRVVYREMKNADIKSTRILADRLAVNYRSLMYWLDGSRKCPAGIVPTICKVLKNFELLDYLETQADRVAFLLPQETDRLHMAEVQAIQRLVKEVAEALNELAKTLEDNIVEKQELEQTNRELDDVIRECAALKHWLKIHYESDSRAKKRMLTAVPTAK